MSDKNTECDKIQNVIKYCNTLPSHYGHLPTNNREYCIMQIMDKYIKCYKSGYKFNKKIE